MLFLITSSEENFNGFFKLNEDIEELLITTHRYRFNGTFAAFSSGEYFNLPRQVQILG